MEGSDKQKEQQEKVDAVVKLVGNVYSREDILLQLIQNQMNEKLAINALFKQKEEENQMQKQLLYQKAKQVK